MECEPLLGLCERLPPPPPPLLLLLLTAPPRRLPPPVTLGSELGRLVKIFFLSAEEGGAKRGVCKVCVWGRVCVHACAQ